MDKELTKNKYDNAVAIDTNMFINLFKVNADYEPKKRNQAGFYQTIRDMKRIARNGNLKFVLTRTAVEEIMMKLGIDDKKFMEEYCYIFDEASIPNYEEMVDELAEKLISEKLVRSPDGNVTCDAIIIAESALVGLSLVTANANDMIVFNHGSKNYKRAKKIQEVVIEYLKTKGIKTTDEINTILPETFLSNFKQVHYGTKQKLFKASFNNLKDIMHLDEVYFLTPEQQYVL